MSKEQENLRQKFVNETKSKLWLEDFTQDAGFSDAYVDWLEKQLLLYNIVGQSEQFNCFLEESTQGERCETKCKDCKDYKGVSN